MLGWLKNKTQENFVSYLNQILTNWILTGLPHTQGFQENSGNF